VGIDSRRIGGEYRVHQYTGDVARTRTTPRNTLAWAAEAAKRGAGEIVLNCMDQDGTRDGYDIVQLRALRDTISIPLIASGGAGRKEHFLEAFREARVDGALAAGIFHRQVVTIEGVKQYLAQQQIVVRT
jgi:cyclase